MKTSTHYSCAIHMGFTIIFIAIRPIASIQDSHQPSQPEPVHTIPWLASARPAFRSLSTIELDYTSNLS